MRHGTDKKQRPALGSAGLERLALHYAGRYATTRSRLAAYLARKVRERGWAEDGQAQDEVARIVERFQSLGYVNDGAFAEARAESLGRRGFGERRVAQALRAAGIEDADAHMARAAARDGAWAAVLRFARRKRLGPYAAQVPDHAQKQKAFAALMRAGHSADLARRVLEMAPGSADQADESNFA